MVSNSDPKRSKASDESRNAGEVLGSFDFPFEILDFETLAAGSFEAVAESAGMSAAELDEGFRDIAHGRSPEQEDAFWERINIRGWVAGMAVIHMITGAPELRSPIQSSLAAHWKRTCRTHAHTIEDVWPCIGNVWMPESPRSAGTHAGF